MSAPGLEKLVPDRRLLLDGNVVAAEVAAKITRITVELSDGVFNECRIVFNDADLKLIGGTQLTGGVAVQVELGYQGALQPVFDGEIVSVEPRFVRDHPPSVVVRALEPLHRLALAPKTRSFQDVTTAQIVSQVAKEHGLSGEGPSGGSAAHLLQPNISDYTLLRKIAARTGNRISLDGKKLTLGPPPSMGEVAVNPGDGVKHLKVALRTSEQVPKVVVRGWDWAQKKEIVGQAQPQGEAKDGADAAKPFGVTEFFIEGILVHDTAEAQAIAQATVTAIAERYATAQGELLGNADVLPGKVLAFDKMGDLLDGKYRVRSARHEFDKRGYRVYFDATRVAKKQTTTKFKAPPEIKNEETTFIESALVDQSGNPISGVKATIEVSGEAPVTMYTDAKGKVRVDGVAKGKSYSITFFDSDEPSPGGEEEAPPPAESSASAGGSGSADATADDEASSGSASADAASDGGSATPEAAGEQTAATADGATGTAATDDAAASDPAAAADANPEEQSPVAVEWSFVDAEGQPLGSGAVTVSAADGSSQDGQVQGGALKLQVPSGGLTVKVDGHIVVQVDDTELHLSDAAADGEPAAVEGGAVQLPAAKATQKFVVVEDVLPAARLAHKDYLDARDELVKWSADPERSARKYIGEWCEGLANEAKFKDRIALDVVESAKSAYVQGLGTLRDRVEQVTKPLSERYADRNLRRELAWMGIAGIREAAALLQGVGESATGSDWIEHELGASGEEGGILAWVLSDDAAEIVEAEKADAEAMGPVLDALAETAGTMVRTKKEQAVEFVAQLVAVRFKLQATDLVTRQLVEIRGGMTAAVVYSREVTVLKSSKLLSSEAVEKFGRGLEAFDGLVAAIDLAAKLHLLVEDPSFKNALSTVGALASLLDTSETVSSLTKKFVRFGREVGADGAPKAVEAAGELGEAGEAAGKTFLKFLGESAAKKLTPLAVVAGLADMVTGSMDAYEEEQKGNYAGTAAKGAVALGGALLAIAGTMELAGLGADATVAGAPAGIVVGIAGLVVGLAGAIASLFTGESELEAWADHCEFGRHPYQDKYGDFRGHLDKQIEALNDAVYQVKFKGDVKQDTTFVELEPTGLTKSSNLTCFVNVTSSSGATRTAREDLPVRDDQSDCEIVFDGDRVKSVKVRVSMPPAADGDWTRMAVNCRLDPDGNGGAINRFATLEQGMLDWAWSKL